MCIFEYNILWNMYNIREYARAIPMATLIERTHVQALMQYVRLTKFEVREMYFNI
jgi:hypothetical protein